MNGWNYLNRKFLIFAIPGSPGIPNNLENLVASIFYPRSHSEPHESIVNPVTPQSNSTEAYLTDQVIQLLATKLSPNTLGAATTGRIPSVNNLQTSTNLFPQLGNVVPTPTAIPQVLQSLGLQMNTRPFNSASTCDPVMSTKTPVIRYASCFSI